MMTSSKNVMTVFSATAAAAAADAGEQPVSAAPSLAGCSLFVKSSVYK